MLDSSSSSGGLTATSTTNFLLHNLNLTSLANSSFIPISLALNLHFTLMVTKTGLYKILKPDYWNQLIFYLLRIPQYRCCCISLICHYSFFIILCTYITYVDWCCPMVHCCAWHQLNLPTSSNVCRSNVTWSCWYFTPSPFELK